MITRCIHGVSYPEKTCSPCREMLGRGIPIRYERASSPARVYRQEKRGGLVEVPIDDSPHRRAPTVEEIKEAEENPGREPDQSKEETMDVLSKKCPKGDHPTDRFKKDGSPGVCHKCRSEAMSEAMKAAKGKKKENPDERSSKNGQFDKKTRSPIPKSDLWLEVMEELQARLKDRIQEARDIHRTMILVKEMYGVDFRIEALSLVGS